MKGHAEQLAKVKEEFKIMRSLALGKLQWAPLCRQKFSRRRALMTNPWLLGSIPETEMRKRQKFTVLTLTSDESKQQLTIVNRKCLPVQLIALIIFFAPSASRADESSRESTSDIDLVAASQNPLASLITLPFQNNMGVLENGDIFNVMNIQPVIPFEIGENWNLITRTIIPLIGVENAPPGVDTFSLGDIQQSLLFSPRNPRDPSTLFGFGPIISYPTATESALGSEQFGVGPSMVGVFFRGPWVFGLIANHVASVSGKDGRPDLNRTALQPFVNYNLDDGWFLQSAPFITADWSADSNDRWTLPIGGGIGRTYAIGSQPVSTVVSAFYNVEHPTGQPEWTFRFQFNFLFRVSLTASLRADKF